MEKLFKSRIFWGSLLIFGGILALVDNLGIVKIADLFWVIVTGIIAAVFFGLFARYRFTWWWIIPGLFFTGIALSILINWLFPSIGSQWGGPIILFFLGIGFFTVYFAENQHWWTIIFGGIFLAVGILAGFASQLSSSQGVGLFVIGMGITFSLVALLPTQAGTMKWAWIPAGILLTSGIIFTVSKGQILFYVVPGLIILLGILLIIRYSRQQAVIT